MIDWSKVKNPYTHNIIKGTNKCYNNCNACMFDSIVSDIKSKEKVSFKLVIRKIFA